MVTAHATHIFTPFDIDIEYGLFEDVINSYYLDSQIKDDFKCNQECYTDIQETQQDQ